MFTPLIDWLYTDDKRGALILFPRMLDRWNVASIIISEWDHYKVIIVTDHPDELMETFNTEWTNLELIPFPLIKYSDLDSINKALKNTDIDIILFDDARMLATISPALEFGQISPLQPKIIILTTWGDTMKQLDIITSKLPNLQLLSLDIINNNINIEWKNIYIPLSDRQLKYYNQVRAQEIKDSMNHSIPYPITRMLTLYSYPDTIMADTLIHKYICETDQSTMPDKLVSSTWLNPSYLNTLNEDGPKLTSLLDGIISNWPSKQVVMTRFNHRYGVDLITSFLELMTENKQNPYDLDQIFHTSCTDEYETIINTLHKFNSSTSGVLITNIIPLIPLKGVMIIHIADTYSFLNIRMLLDRCHKRFLNQNKHNLIVYSYIATYPEEKNIRSSISTSLRETEKTADEVLHEISSDNIREAKRIYTGLISVAGRLVLNPTIGLVVQSPINT